MGGKSAARKGVTKQTGKNDSTYAHIPFLCIGSLHDFVKCIKQKIEPLKKEIESSKIVFAWQGKECAFSCT